MTLKEIYLILKQIRWVFETDSNTMGSAADRNAESMGILVLVHIKKLNEALQMCNFMTDGSTGLIVTVNKSFNAIQFNSM